MSLIDSMKHVLLNIYQIIHNYENRMLCLLFCVLCQLFTSRLRHGHTEGKVVLLVVGTFWSPNQKTIVVDDYTCFLGHLASSKTPTTKTTVTTSTTPTIRSCEDNTAFFHDPISALENNDGKTRATSGDDCQKACIDNHECQYWSWFKWIKGDCYGDPPCGGNCYLKAEKKIVRSNSQFISGNRHCTPVWVTTGKCASFNHNIGKLAKHNFSGEQEN